MCNTDDPRYKVAEAMTLGSSRNDNGNGDDNYRLKMNLCFLYESHNYLDTLIAFFTF